MGQVKDRISNKEKNDIILWAIFAADYFFEIICVLVLSTVIVWWKNKHNDKRMIDWLTVPHERLSLYIDKAAIYGLKLGMKWREKKEEEEDK